MTTFSHAHLPPDVVMSWQLFHNTTSCKSTPNLADVKCVAVRSMLHTVMLLLLPHVEACL
jgi:hypothetical protein